MRARSGSRQHQNNAYARVDFGHTQTTPILNLIEFDCIVPEIAATVIRKI
jgi:hypothetical protein